MGLVKRVKQLTQMVIQLSKTQSNTFNLLGKGQVVILKQMGLSREEACERLGIPMPAPVTKLPPEKQLPAPTAFDMAALEAALAKSLSLEQLDLFLNKKTVVFQAVFGARNGGCSKNPRIRA